MTEPRPQRPPTQRPPTLRDVARLAEVDSSVVSRVLRGASGANVRPETRERIEQVARDLGYSPNPLARGLRTQRTDCLALVVPQLDNPVFQQIAQGAERAAAARGFALVTYHVRDAAQERERLEHLVRSIRVDGVVIATLMMAGDAHQFFERLGLPCVLVNREAPGVPNFVSADDEAGAHLATAHLLRLGHRRIAHIAGPHGRYNAIRRREGYERALREAGVAPEARLVVPAEYSFEGGRVAMATLLNAGMTAVFATTLLSGIGALRTLADAGRRVPEDVSVIALHDAPVAEMVTPPLTTVRFPTEAMGADAVDAVIDQIVGQIEGQIDGQPRRLERRLAPEGLIERGSCAPPRG
ncbi:LacI family DNA-binding transcriptional regulator [Azospirillum sp.]|uniref:LacI family DNA-binding transcriptional regulator n=1 Tax=Azospirillum sp. TaxID=34012 RepID=UPI002D674F87|nr:LacI family DNA-binding transcriptional regulator [Azospirillum sp.]HYD67065.1 LacI family DNA-binding transcriptional regulator [Azospirillum sp.]